MTSSKIYTKHGDKGETSLGSGQRVSKSSLRVRAYGSVDELNSYIGLLLTYLDDNLCESKVLNNIQNTLFNIGALLANPNSSLVAIDVSFLEDYIDQVQDMLPALHSFILPGGTRSAALAHVCRTVCRRAECNIVSLSQHETVDSSILIFMNRLSDLFFVMARNLNFLAHVSEKSWINCGG